MSGRWATFDCYGTLADWIGGLEIALRPHAGERTDELLEAYFEVELDVQREQPGMPYRDVLAETTRRAAERIALELPAGAEHDPADRWSEMPIFEDTAPTLRQLREDGWQLAILTNCDDDLIAQTVESIGIEFDEVVTAQQVGSYKPDPGHFHEFDRRTQGRREHWVHCANSWVHDITPARTLALPRVWVDRDRTGHDPEAATVRIEDLRPLPEVLRSLPR